MYWIKFLISAVVIIAAGIRLTVYADRLSAQLRLGAIWVGLVLLGFVTSLPEAITSLTAVVSLGANDLAAGNIFGSNNFNLLLVVVMDLMYRRGSVTSAVKASSSHDFSVLVIFTLSLILAAEIILSPVVNVPNIYALSLGNFLVLVFYFAAMKHLVKLNQSTKMVADKKKMTRIQKTKLRNIGLNIFISAAVVVGAAMILAQAADEVAVNTQLGRTFVGTIFLAIVTSLPELVVTLSALKLNSLDLAIGNILGSNITNLFILSVCSLFARQGLLLASISQAHVFTIVLSLLLVGILFWGIHSRKKSTLLGIGIDSLLILFLFIIGTRIIYNLR